MEPERTPGVHRPMKRLNPTVIALIGGVLVLLLLIAYFASSRNPDQDKLTDEQIAQQGTQATSPEKRCASKMTYDAIKRELFRRAAQLRGSDQAAYDRLSAYAVLRMENPVLESENGDALNCSGSLSLDLPPGVAVVGGRRTLSADVDYTVQPSADGAGDVVLLKNADAVITPLATLARTAQPAQQPPVQGTPTTGVDSLGQPTGNMPPPAPPATAPAEPPQAPSAGGARPSFNCANARTRGEIAVCSSSGLAALDRQMAAQYARSMAAASPEQRRLLQRTRDRFLAYRDRCPSNSCISDAYNGRMREISDIMAGRWRSR